MAPPAAVPPTVVVGYYWEILSPAVGSSRPRLRAWPPPQKGHARFHKEEKMSRARGPRREQLSYHITTPLLRLSIRKCTDFMPKSPVFLLRET